MQIPLPLKSEVYFDPKKFELFCRDLLSLVNQKKFSRQLKTEISLDFIARGEHGESQGGYDILSYDGKIKADAKWYQEKISKAKLTAFFKKFFESPTNSKDIEQLLFIVPHKAKYKDLIDEIVKNTENNLAQNVKQIVTFWDAEIIEAKIRDGAYYSLVKRYFGDTVFKDFFGKKIFNALYDTPGSFRHYTHELRTGDPSIFLLEVSESIIKEKKVIFDEEKIKKINHHLAKNKVCVISASEGRGKTVLSRIIAYNKYTHEDFDVFFVNLKAVKDIKIIDEQLQRLLGVSKKNKNQAPQKYLIVLEDAHGYSEIDQVLESVHYHVESKKNLFFLINSRQSTEGYFNDWSNDFIVRLLPAKRKIQAIIELYEHQIGRKAISNTSLTQFINDNIYTGKSTEGANLRILNIILDTWKNRDGSLDETFDENAILKKIRKNFKIGESETSQEKIDILHFFTTIFQYDVPFVIDSTKSPKQFAYLKQLENEGFCKYENGEFHFPHSVDARYTSKAISQFYSQDYEENNVKFIKKYIENFIEARNPNNEKIFVQLARVIKKLSQEDPILQSLYDEFRSIQPDHWASRIILNVSADHIYRVTQHHYYITPQKVVMGFYNKLKVQLSQCINYPNPFFISFVFKNFKINYDYHDVLQDFFFNEERMANMLRISREMKSNYGLKSYALEKVESIPAYAHLVKEYKEFKESKHEQNNEINLLGPYRFNQNEVLDGIEISPSYCREGFYYYEGQISWHFIKKMKTLIHKSYYFRNVSWRSICYILIGLESLNQQGYRREWLMETVKELIEDTVFHEDGLNHISIKDLSTLLGVLFNISETYAAEILNRSKVRNLISEKLKTISITTPGLYLLASLYNQNFERYADSIIPIINESTSQEQEIINEWLQKIKQNHPELDKASFAYYLEEKLKGH